MHAYGEYKLKVVYYGYRGNIKLNFHRNMKFSILSNFLTKKTLLFFYQSVFFFEQFSIDVLLKIINYKIKTRQLQLKTHKNLLWHSVSIFESSGSSQFSISCLFCCFRNFCKTRPNNNQDIKKAFVWSRNVLRGTRHCYRLFIISPTDFEHRNDLWKWNP
jgi:hypothetical protein